MIPISCQENFGQEVLNNFIFTFIFFKIRVKIVSKRDKKNFGCFSFIGRAYGFKSCIFVVNPVGALFF